MHSNEIIGIAVALSALAFILFLQSEVRRKWLALILATLVPGCLFIIVDILGNDPISSGWVALLGILTLSFSIPLNLFILLIHYLIRRFRQ